MKFFTTSALAAALGAATALADPISHCARSDNNICYQVAVPSSSASSGSGNIYFQISAPTKYQWVALGTGRGMSGTNVFIMYQDGNDNVTISPRVANGFQEPQVQSGSGGADLELLPGSGIDGDKMVANVRCGNCQSWNGGRGTMQLDSTRTPWVSAWRTGDALDTTSVDTDIKQHNDDPESFSIDLTQATISRDENPFTGSNAEGPARGGGSSQGVEDTGNGGGDGSGTSNALMAHGIVMTVVFVVLYPLGAILMPVLGKWFIHGTWQIVAFLAMWAGFALGYQFGEERGLLFNNTHTILGTVVVSLLGIQPVLGFLHHLHFRKHQKRGLISHAHIWYGRALMVLGIVNGGLGLKLAGGSGAFIAAYIAITIVMALLYLMAIGFKMWRSRRTTRTIDSDRSGK